MKKILFVSIMLFSIVNITSFTSLFASEKSSSYSNYLSPSHHYYGVDIGSGYWGEGSYHDSMSDYVRVETWGSGWKGACYANDICNYGTSTEVAIQSSPSFDNEKVNTEHLW